RLKDYMEAMGAHRLNSFRFASAIVAVIWLAGASAHSGILALRDTWRTFEGGTLDFAVAHRQRVMRATTLLPERGTVGYISDSNDEGEFYLTQYLIVPRVLEKGQRPDLVLVNNHLAKGNPVEGEGYTCSLLADGSMVYDFGNGIKLIDRRHQP